MSRNISNVNMMIDHDTYPMRNMNSKMIEDNDLELQEDFGHRRFDNCMNISGSKKRAYQPMHLNEDIFADTILDMVSENGDDFQA